MPATEKTWRDQKLLHVAFGVTGLVMFIATVWMLVIDHVREWKGYQRQFRGVMAANTQWKINAEQSADFEARTNELESELMESQTQLPGEDLVKEFAATVMAYRQFQQDENGSIDWGNLPPYDSLSAEDNTGVLEAYDEARSVFAGETTPASKLRARNEFLEELERIAKRAKTEEDFISNDRRFWLAEFSVMDSNVGIAVRDGKSAEEIAAIQAQVDEIKDRVGQLSQKLQDAEQYRKTLEEIYAQIVAEETAAQKSLDDHRANWTRLQGSLAEQQLTQTRSLLELPVVDAFSPVLKVEQIWLPDLTVDINFRRIARFDRCTTCHTAIEQTQAGSAVKPAFEPEHVSEFQLETPEIAPELEREAANSPRALELVYGITLAEQGVLDPDDVTVSIVAPESLAANAGVMPGDVLEKVNDAVILTKQHAVDQLIRLVEWGQTVTLTLRRGLPHPFSTHPRMDLFVGSLSPHKMMEFGCTTCHEGQGSATAFKWASHTPNTPLERNEWRQEHGWFDNHHWIFPMYPQRFVESGCLKCHHDVNELEPTERFPDPPAPQLVEGYKLIQKMGCFGCHEINGYDGPDKRIGPDLRLEPQIVAASEALLADENLTDQARGWAESLVENPEDDQVRHLLAEYIAADAERATASGTPDGQADQEPSALSRNSHRILEVLSDVEAPGTYQKVGPSLRRIASKLTERFMFDWLRDPTNFRPTTAMPRFFGLYDHLDENGQKVAEKFEPVEIRAITHYLLSKSESFEPVAPPEGITEDPSAERGKLLFQTRCIACHQHSDFPEATADFGPNLSRLGSKLLMDDNVAGAKWLDSWLRNPSHYNPQAKMPNLFLDPIQGEDGAVTDPVADIWQYLLSSQGWEPAAFPDLDEDALDELALEHMGGTFTRRQSQKYLSDGIPETMADQLKGDEIELVGEMTLAKKMNYVGRRSITKYGCYGCHDIPGFEAAKPIGTGLANWGRKDPVLIAFEHINEYLQHEFGGRHGENGGHEHLRPQDLGPDNGFFVQAIQDHQRTGFLWQKLREPRSYDYHKTENKGYNERLRMPKFNLTQEQIEAIMTFVLGLVSDPPKAEYVYSPTPRRQAEIEGMQVLEKYNCGGCHILKMERWEFDYHPDEIFLIEPLPDYAFLNPHFSPAEVKESTAVDRRGMGHAVAHGRPDIDDQGNIQFYDEEYTPLFPEDLASGEYQPHYQVELWRPALVHGLPRNVGEKSPLILPDHVTQRYSAVGGDLGRLIYAKVLEEERQRNPAANAAEVWGWLPPPLVGEGKKVQPDWLHNFLLDPFPIRPATILRMPKFNMSRSEAAKLVDYFAAADDAKYPYEYDPRTLDQRITTLEEVQPGRLDAAMNIVTNNNYCVKCHNIGDYSAVGKPTSFNTDKAAAPNLARVYNRLRPDWVKRWVANPKKIVPYTPMPVNIPADKPVDQSLFEGTSEEQLDGVVDLLVNFDWYARSKTSIREIVPEPPEQPAAAAGGE